MQMMQGQSGDWSWWTDLTGPNGMGAPQSLTGQSFMLLQAYEARLLKLEAFLKDYQQRRRERASNARGNVSLGGEPSASGRGGFGEYPQASTQGYSGMPPSKRPRLEEAAKQEDQR